MGTLLKYLLSAKGERGLLGKIGQWRLKVSQALDDLAQAAEKGFFQATFLENSPAFLTGDVVAPETVLVQSGITYDANTGNFTLEAGKTYRLSAQGVVHVPGDATSGILVLAWQDVDGNEYGVRGRYVTTTYSASDAGMGFAEAVIDVTEDTILRLVVTSSPAVTGAQFTSSYFSLVVVEI